MSTQIISTSESVMLEKFEHNVDSKFPYLRTGKIYLAISGGKDSMTLSHLLIKSKINHTLLHCNFKLRGKESDDDENFLTEYAAKNNLEIFVKHFDTYQISSDQKLSIQECARNLRYEWFRIFLDEHETAYLLTAHHLDDSIETFFINLFRGTGFRGLSGIPVSSNQIIRPLSEFTSEEIYKYIDSNEIEYRSDSTNAKKDYQRNKIRHDLMPLLAEMEPELHSKMKSLFEELNDLKEEIDLEVQNFKEQHAKGQQEKIIYPVSVIQRCSAIFREQLFRTENIYRKNSQEFSKFLTSSTGAQFYTSSHQFLIDRENLIVAPKVNSHHESFTMVHSLPFTTFCGNKNISFSKKTEFLLEKNNSAIQQVDASKIVLPLTIRKWQNADKIQPLGMSGVKLISDILIDKKIDRFEKENCLVLIDSENKMLALLGLVIDERFKISEKTTNILEITTL